jgi:hypothetical protein
MKTTKYPKYPTSLRLSQKAVLILKRLVEHTGVSRGACIELAIRELARKQGVEA